MKVRSLFAAFFATTAALSVFAAEPQRISSADAAKLVAEGKAVLVDVREPAEWAETGVAKPAVLLPRSDFDGAQKQWKEFLAGVGNKQILTYCSHGIRAGRIASKLAEQGFKTANAGRLKDWTEAGLPTRNIETKK
jgi:rhodanese-related sulfurtransferase